MQNVAGAPSMRLPIAERNNLVLERDRRQIKAIPAALLTQMAGQILLMQALHHRNNRSRLLVVQPGDERSAIPIDYPFSRGL